ncbi:MAG: hypothetical protein IPN33_23055 [Saprospiraceae bacterium]|nr:hypothetical protein [Saprospiraceae bacterium]
METINYIIEVGVKSPVVQAYEEDPFNPHAIARQRRMAYQKAVVMKYIDNLLDWGDKLFTQDTMESINEATMLYVLAQDILGPRPIELGGAVQAPTESMTYEKIRAKPDVNDFLLYTEGVVSSGTVKCATSKSEKKLAQAGSFLAFCVPSNPNLRKYWDWVEDRLFKIRHCKNIKGITRQLALFQPPIDPMLLVRARAAGLSIEEVVGLATGSVSVSPYRFTYLIEKAKQYAQTLQSFGSELLSALEKKDGEELGLIRARHENFIFKMSRQLKTNQIKEARENENSLTESRINVENRMNHYEGLINEGLISWETAQQILKHTGNGLMPSAITLLTLSGQLSLIPKIAGIAFSTGAEEARDGAEIAGDVIRFSSGLLHQAADSMSYEGGNQRREQEWKQLRDQAKQELTQIDKQLLAANIRIQIAEKDLEVHDQNWEHGKELLEFYKDKFTNLGLYNYYATTLTRLHRMAYATALRMAQMAEQSYRFERGDDAASFIGSDSEYWQNDRMGLLAGEKLMLSLQQMEHAFIMNHTRDLEITQSFSLRMIDPEKLLDLQNTGECKFKIPEWAFDLMYPKHYRRIIKSVSLTIPCITGPYTGVGCSLALSKGSVRMNESSELSPQMPVATLITTSNAMNDNGMFEFSFRDERYLPFEGAGAINSEWSVQLPPKDYPPFDYHTISDVILHISYNAKDGRTSDAMRPSDSDLKRLISMRNEFPAQLELLKKGEQSVTLNLTEAYFPFFTRKGIQLKKEVSSRIKRTLEKDMPLSAQVLPDGMTLTVSVEDMESIQDALDVLFVVDYHCAIGNPN